MSESSDALKRYFTEHRPVGPDEFPTFGTLAVGNLTLSALSRKLLRKGMHPELINMYVHAICTANSVRIIELVCVQPLDGGITYMASFDAIGARFKKQGLSYVPQETPFRGYLAAVGDFKGFQRHLLDFGEEKKSRKEKSAVPVFLFATTPVRKTERISGKEKVTLHIFGISVVHGNPRFTSVRIDGGGVLLPPDTFLLFQRKTSLNSPRQ
jgi:hypothetical protein